MISALVMGESTCKKTLSAPFDFNLATVQFDPSILKSV